MNFKINIKKLLAAVFAVGLPFVASAQFQILPGYYDLLTNNPALVPLGGTTNQIVLYSGSRTNFVQGSALTNIGVPAIRIPRARGMGFTALLCQTNNVLSGSNIVFNFNLSHDGSNWTTMNPIAATFAPATNSMQGSFVSSACRLWTNFSPLLLSEWPYIRLDSIDMTLMSNHVYLSNITAVVYQQ